MFCSLIPYHCLFLTGVGVPHIVLLIMSYLDTPMLTVVERVSSLWREISQELPVWKHAVLKNVESRVLWRELFERRGWLVDRKCAVVYVNKSTFTHICSNSELIIRFLIS